MIVVLLLAVVAGFLLIVALGWALWFILTTALSGLVIGGLARLILPGRQPIGILATVVCGLGGALVGSAIGQGFHIGRIPTLLVEIGAAMVGVGLWSAQVRRRPVTSGGHRVIDI